MPRAEVEAVFGAGATVSAVRQARVTPPAATAGVWHVEAESRRAVLKLVALGVKQHRRWPAAPEADHPYYWRREPLVYAARLFGEGLGMPTCLAQFEREDGSVALWLEDVSLPPAPEWPLERYELAARHLGRAQAAFAREPPGDAWLSRRWLRAYLELRREDVRLDGEQERLLRLVESSPQTLCHLDLHPGNLFGDDESTVAIDFAYAGLGALGEDAGNLVPDSLLDGFVPPARADELDRLVWRGYLSGLADEGWDGDERRLRLAYVASAHLKFLFIRPWVERGDGRDEWPAVLPLLDAWGEEARQLASSA